MWLDYETVKGHQAVQNGSPKTSLTVTEQLANLRNYYEETSLRYQNSTSREERKHLLIVLKEIAKHARVWHLIFRSI